MFSELSKVKNLAGYATGILRLFEITIFYTFICLS